MLDREFDYLKNKVTQLSKSQYEIYKSPAQVGSRGGGMAPFCFIILCTNAHEYRKEKFVGTEGDGVHSLVFNR